MKSNVRKLGISMVALVITIIVLIVLTSAVVITGVGVPKQAQLAVFYSNIDTVQELVSITMGNNMITAALKGYGDNYKWFGIVENYTETKGKANEPVSFGTMVTGLDKNLARISPDLLEKTSLSQDEKSKYYVDNNGVVYYEGFVYEGQTLYTKGTNNTPVVVTNPTDGSYNADKKVNSPKLLDGMVGIYWDNGEEVYSHINGENADYTRTNANVDFDYDQWYDYVAQAQGVDCTSRWANAKTSDGSYWVWIPRYAYSITSGYHGEGLTYDANNTTTQAGTIEVEFLIGKTNVSTSGKTEYQNVAGPNNWNVHPAFHYDNNSTTGGTSTTGTQLEGIWVAKYEMSGETNGVESTPGNVPTTATIKAVSKPGVRSWRNVTRSNIFLNALNYDTNSINSARLDSHLMKDSEWGAVAYLAHSKYGRNGNEIATNTSTSFYTGGTRGATATTNVLQSTTGNCYGIYDISGGAWEHVAAYRVGASTTDVYSAELVNAEAKYKDVYDAIGVTSGNTTTDYGKIGGKYAYGNALYETSKGAYITSGYGAAGWFGDHSYIVFISTNFLYRGATCNNGDKAGAFAFSCNNGGALNDQSWRVVLWGSLEEI